MTLSTVPVMSRKIPQVNKKSPLMPEIGASEGIFCAYRISSAVGIAGIAPERLVVQLAARFA